MAATWASTSSSRCSWAWEPLLRRTGEQKGALWVLGRPPPCSLRGLGESPWVLSSGSVWVVSGRGLGKDKGGRGCQVRVIPLDGAVVLVDEVPGLAQQLLGGWGALGRPALQFPWKYQGAQAASWGAGSVLDRGGGQRWREQGAQRSGSGQGAGARVRVQAPGSGGRRQGQGAGARVGEGQRRVCPVRWEFRARAKTGNGGEGGLG